MSHEPDASTMLGGDERIVLVLTPSTSLRRFRGRDFVTDEDCTAHELLDLLRLATALKQARRRRRVTPFLPGARLAMIFEATSTRTSCENGIAELGGNAPHLWPGEIHLSGRETIGDTAKTLSRMDDAIEIRATKKTTVDELAAAATVPVINGMDGDRHPCQAMSDALTIVEHAGRLQGVNFTYLGDATNSCNSLSTTLTRLGVNVTVANAPGYEIAADRQERAFTYARESGGSFRVVHDPGKAVRNADFIYTDQWWRTGQEAEREQRLRVFRRLQVNSELLRKAPPGARFMHCLPARRGEEVTDEVIDSEASIVFPQAENRLHFQKALLLALIGIDEAPADPELQTIADALLR
jgi:ornithine carbamoyltransferase